MKGSLTSPAGTSLVAGLLREAGLDIGREESDLGWATAQPLEDHDFYHLNEAILTDFGWRCFTADETVSPASTLRDLHWYGRRRALQPGSRTSEKPDGGQSLATGLRSC